MRVPAGPLHANQAEKALRPAGIREVVGSIPTVGSHGPGARMDGRSRPKREAAGSNPAGATMVGTLRQRSSLGGEPSRCSTVIGKDPGSEDPGSTGFKSPAPHHHYGDVAQRKSSYNAIATPCSPARRADG